MPSSGEALFRAMVETSPAGLALAGADGTLTRVNPAACRLWGRSERELVGSAELELVHDPGYVFTVRALGDSGVGEARHAGLGAGDNPVFPKMHEVSALVAGGSIEAARSVMEGTVPVAFNIAGGLHHALPATARLYSLRASMSVRRPPTWTLR